MARATITWDEPTTRVDGSPLSAADIAAIDIYDNNSVEPNEFVGSLSGGVKTFETNTLIVGQHDFYIIVRDTTGHSSEPSVASTVMVPATLPIPSPATNVKAVLIND